MNTISFMILSLPYNGPIYQHFINTLIKHSFYLFLEKSGIICDDILCIGYFFVFEICDMKDIFVYPFFSIIFIYKITDFYLEFKFSVYNIREIKLD